MVNISSVASAFPAAVAQEDLWNGYFQNYFGNSRLARATFLASNVAKRHAVANPLEVDLSETPTSVRMERFVEAALPLGKGAIAKALGDARLVPADLGLFVVATCTGYATPGIDVLLSRDLAMAPSIERVLVGHVGCHAAIPAIKVAHDYVATWGLPALVLSVELPSLHLQPRGSDVDQIVPHALFSDGAAAVVIEATSTKTGALEVVDFATRSLLVAAEDLTWQITDKGFRMRVSRHLPAVIAGEVRPLVEELLDRHDLRIEQVAQWAVHPGGPRVLDQVESSLGLGPSVLASSRKVLHDHGNCSSVTVMLIIKEILREVSLGPDEPMVVLAFGPGLTSVAMLVRGS